MILHNYSPSQNGWKIRVVLYMLRIPYESREVSIFAGESRTPAFLELNPTGVIPVLQLDDGRVLSESNAILRYLTAGSYLLPNDLFLQGKVDQWLCFEQYNIEPVVGSLRFWTLTGRLRQHAALVPGKRDAAANALEVLNRGLQDGAFLVADRLTIADIAVYAYGHLAGDCGLDLGAYPNISGWAVRVSQAIGSNTRVIPYEIDPLSMIVE